VPVLIEDEVSTAATPTPWERVVQWKLLRQFVKFCVVGASSTAIDLGSFAALLHHDVPFLLGEAIRSGVGGRVAAILLQCRVPLLLTNTFSFILAVTNGFFWNRRWTFRAMDPTHARRQYLSFFAVNIIGFLLNTTILLVLSHFLQALGTPAQRAALLGKMAAVPIVAIWNFTASKVWAFASR
jgi:putative flippase GtrA